ncbi:FAD binding domain-containing protein [Infundibulicybe gibba]|nr:FAD binding domain-containing protein [Infundibulicybe gibba]
MAILPNTLDSYVEPYTTEHQNKSLPNHLGVNNINPAVPNFHPRSEVDVMIVGGGPVGLATAASLARQGVSFRILDKSPHPLIVGRADSLQPRTMEVFHQLGLGEEVFGLGPRLEHTVVYKDGKKQIFAESHRSPGSESRYQGLHDATQTEVEHLLIRDLIRNDVLVERPCTATSYRFDEEADASVTHPITVNITNHATGEEEVVKARFLVGSDGAHSMIRKSIPDIKFDGIKTDLHWGIVDAVFETDFPHRWTFGTVINSEHGGCLIIPRERDMVRLYAQLRPEPGKNLTILSSCATQQDFAPYYLKYASPVDWYTILTISERVASTFTYKDRIFLAGDSCHVHSAKGAFGMNTGIMDAHNLAWKLAMLSKGIAKPGLLDTYDAERRENALRAVATSARYLRFVGNCTFQNIDGTDAENDEMKIVAAPGEDPDIAFFKQFAQQNTRFLIGLDVDYAPNLINHPIDPEITGVRSGYRTPDPRVAISRHVSGRLYDSFGRVDQFTIVVFGSGLSGVLLPKLQALDSYLASPKSFYSRYAASDLFKVVLVARATPTEGMSRVKALPFFAEHAQVVYDDQLPVGIFGGDAHAIYGVDHKIGAIVAVRPDTWVGTAVTLDGVAKLEGYFSSFLY